MLMIQLIQYALVVHKFSFNFKGWHIILGLPTFPCGYSHQKLIIYRFLAQNIGIQSGPNASIFLLLHVGHHNTYRCGTTHWFSWDMFPIQYMPISKISGSKFIQIVACSVRKEPLMCEGKNKRQWMAQSFFTHSSEHVIQIRNQVLVISNLPYLQRKRALFVGNKY